MDNFCLKIRNFTGPFISLVTEPAVKLGQAVGLERGINVFSKGLKPHAAIVASKDIRLSLVPEYSGRDVTVCLWHTECQEYPLIYVISLYWDYTGTNSQIPKEQNSRFGLYLWLGYQRVVYAMVGIRNKS